MSRTAHGLVLAGGGTLLLLVLLAWPSGAAQTLGPRTCLSIGQPIGGGPPISCLTVGPRPRPPTTIPPPPPPPPPRPTVPPPVVALPAPVVAPAATRPAVVLPSTTVPTTVPTRPVASPPRTTVPAALPVGALPPPISVAAERDKERRWALTAVILLIGGGAVAGRMRSRSRAN
jgi:hypothetical protein